MGAEIPKETAMMVVEHAYLQALNTKLAQELELANRYINRLEADKAMLAQHCITTTKLLEDLK